MIFLTVSIAGLVFGPNLDSINLTCLISTETTVFSPMGSQTNNEGMNESLTVLEIF